MEHLDPQQACEFLRHNPDAVFIDCRSETEYWFVGHPIGTIHIAWSEAPDWEVNPHFVARVRAAADVTQPVVLICRSGSRSADAGRALEQAGYTRVYNVLEGFEGDRDEHHHRGTRGGWRHRGLPWEQS